jgi:hypothetical protein
VSIILSLSLSGGPTDLFALLRAKCGSYSGLDGTLLVLQGVSSADDFVMVFVNRTNMNCLLCFRRLKETGRTANGDFAASPKTSTLVPRLFARCSRVISVVVTEINLLLFFLAREMHHVFGPGWLTLGAAARKYR